MAHRARNSAKTAATGGSPRRTSLRVGAKRGKILSQSGGTEGEANTSMVVDDPMEVDNDVMQSIPTSSTSRTLVPAVASTQVKKKDIPMTGTKRFIADQTAMKELCKQGYEVRGLQARYFRAGDDKGNLEFKVERDGTHIVSVSLLVSDTSEYPKDHTFFSFSQDPDVSPAILQVIEDVASDGSRTIEQTISRYLANLAKALGGCSTAGSSNGAKDGNSADDGEDDDDDDFNMSDDDHDTFGTAVDVDTTLQRKVLQGDFLQIVAAGYRPGTTRFGATDIVISVSLPVLHLSIPPRALMAWDRRLLSSTQHLTLLVSGLRGVYPPLRPDGTTVLPPGALQFRVGLSPRYKPGKDNVAEAVRNFSLQSDEPIPEPEPVVPLPVLEPDDEDDEDDEDPDLQTTPELPQVEEELTLDEGRFEKFSLSSSLESLLDQWLVRLVQLRLKFKLGWAGAEYLLAEVEKQQTTPENLFGTMKHQLVLEDKTEAKLQRSHYLPPDPLTVLQKEELNLPLIAFCYLVRRLTLCTRYCLVCHTKINSEFEALKPYVCDSKLCAYRYYAHNHGPSIEYEIRTNPEVVDLLVSLAHVAASEGALEEPLPVGMGLRVPVPKVSSSASAPPGVFHLGIPGRAAPPPLEPPRQCVVGPDGLCEFDDLALVQMRASIAELIDTLPSIAKMKKHMERKVIPGKAKPKLRDIAPSVLPAAWSILRWCVASCTAYLEEVTEEDDILHNIDSAWRQFRFSVGAPNAEAKFKASVLDAQKQDANANVYPSLYAFHGSRLRCWHSIIRHGLWFREVVNGRAYGNGVYFAKDGATSMGGYAQASSTRWKNSDVLPTACVALAEIVNLPKKFISSSPHFVVADTHWIVCRYLLVRSLSGGTPAPQLKGGDTFVPYVKLDPAHPVTLNAKPVGIPEQSYKLDRLLEARRMEHREEDYDEEDSSIFASGDQEVIEIKDSPSPEPQVATVDENDWKHDPDWVEACIKNLMPPPVDSTPGAAMALQKELKLMLREQQGTRSLKELGWYMPPEVIGDNLFQWIVELHSFDESLPIAQDMILKGLNSLVFEIRFPPTFPHSPPFFRIIKPRFLPFIHGGGGHVTGGGSMCMDLLTADGWLPSYSISAVLLQIRLAISNLEPKPARLSPNWDAPYSVYEALEGYKRAANTHGWTIPQGLDKLLR